MKGRGGGNGGGGPPTDLLVCFPTRAHLALMPKPICSPSRPSDPPKRHLSRTISRGQASPLFKTKTKPTGSDISEPTSPKVTCAGQIKVRPTKPVPTKNWFTVMEEMEKKLHKQRKKPSWSQALGLKKDLFHLFNSSLRSLHFSMNCFWSFHGSVICSSDEDEGEEDEEEEEEKERKMESDASGAIFSKWFMILEENPSDEFKKEVGGDEEKEEDFVAPPPPNALLLMRSRSAPAKGWSEREGEVGEEEIGGELSRKKMKKEEEERVVLMSYAPDFYKVSSDVVKETWLVGSLDPMARSLSCKR